MCYSNEFLIQVLGFLFVCLLFLKGGGVCWIFFLGGGLGGLGGEYEFINEQNKEFSLLMVIM